MAIHHATLTDGSITVALDTVDDWDEFAADNIDALISEYGSAEQAHKHLVDGGLMLGGGAAPQVLVYYDDL